MFENPMGMGAPMMGGYANPGVQQPVQKFDNPLTPEQIKKLQQKSEQFSLGITEEEWLRGICNHRNAEGTSDSLVYDPVTGEARCTICGYKFKPVDSNMSPESIRDAVDQIVDILQTIKLMYVDLPKEAAKEYFQIIPLLNKIPQLFEFAAKNMSKHEAYNWQYNGRNMGTMSMFSNLQNMLAGGMNMFGGVNPNPAMNGYYNMQQPPVGSAFGYPGAGGPVPAPNPVYQNPGFAYTPNVEQATSPVPPTVTSQVAPEAPTMNPGETKVTQSVTV